MLVNTFLNFLSDNTFFAIFSGVIIVLVLAFIITLVKGQKGVKTQEETIKISQENIAEFSTNNNINSQTSMIETQMLETNSLDTGYQAAFTNYIPDLNEEKQASLEIPNVVSNISSEESTFAEPRNFSISERSSSVSINQENIPDIPSINEPNFSPINATGSSVNAELLVNNELADLNIPDFSIKDETVAVEPINEVDENDEIEMPIPIIETPELAFASLPSEDKSINENIKIEQSQEYDFEKTEIFDFPDFSKTETASEKLLIDVEKVVMEAANKYIDSVMKS